LNRLTHIFFDLDHTLWDYDTSSTEALTKLYEEFGLAQLFTSTDAFIKVFHHVNGELWDQYNKGKIDREYIRKHRFARVVSGRMEPDEGMTNDMSDFFISYCPTLPNLIEGAVELLEALKDHFVMGIISNGFTDTQSTKLKSSGIDHYFKYVITSESANSRKPDTAIFEHALDLSSASIHEVIMIGDNLTTDIAGAKAAGWQAIWFCPDPDQRRHNKPHQPMIRHLKEILDLVSS
jgi:YjjG family noncanonical pyrimidine nucleotidase